VRSVLLDVDGVLLDSAGAFRSVWAQWAARHGLAFERVWEATHGRRPVDTIAEVAPHLDSDSEYIWLQTVVEDPGLSFPPIEGAVEFLRGLPKGRWGLVTSGHEERVRSRFLKAGLLVPEIIVDGLCVPIGKPAPDCYQLGAARLGSAPSECLAVEDAPAGVRSARDAGAYVIALSTTHAKAALQDAHVVVRGLEEAGHIIADWFRGESGSRTSN
jgi:mannitol-1-/sugar-/sorbitol-6-phosphatase